MERVVASQHHSKRGPETQLNEIEAKQHQNEARRLKQIRDLGVDLSKIHKTSRDLDDVIQDMPPRNYQQRRGSLPPLDSRGLPFQLEQPRTPRSRRRLSCIADISLTTPEHAGYLTNAFSAKGNMAVERHMQLPAIKKDNSESKSKASSPESEMSRENNILKTKSDKRKNSNDVIPVSMSRPPGRRGSIQTNDTCNNNNYDCITTKIYLDSENKSEMPEARPSSDDISEVELQSIFADAKRSNRRSSEPELRSNFIRGLQDITLGEIPSFQYPNGVESEELRKSIQKNLPSDIVAEIDEDETEADAIKDERADDNINLSPSPRLRLHLTSISESDQDSDQTETSSMSGLNKFEAGSKNEREASVGSLQVADKKNVIVLGRRRKSDGDVLIHGFPRKFYSAEKTPFGKLNRGKIGDLTTVTATTKNNLINKESLK